MSAVRDVLLGTALDGRYRVDALIARGGMSGVYLAMDLRLQRPVAVKVMDPRYSSDQQFMSRFEFEARSVARLKDPGLVPVYDQGVDGEYVFLVMELVEGGTLRELLSERGPMPPHAAVAVMLPVLGGLGTAHRHGLVHRDVKPENVLISDTGEVKVVDFGLVRAVAAAGITSDSIILGTAAYLSPEQVESADADSRSDVYSAGVLLYELLTGTTPFAGDTPLALAYARLRTDVGPPSRVIDGIPRALDHVVLTATDRDPGRRYADADEMLDAVAELADRLSLPAFTVPAPSRSAERATAIAHRTRHGEIADPGAEPVAPTSPPPPARTRTFDAPPPPTRGPADSPDTARPTFDPRDAPAYARANGDHPGQAVVHRPALAAAARSYAGRRRRARRRALMVTVLVLVLAAGVAAAGWWLGAAVAGAQTPQPRSISATKNASSSDCWVLSLGSQAVS